MQSKSQKQILNKSCVYCGNKVRDNYFVLSDDSYIHKECLKKLQQVLQDVALEQEMRHLYEFLHQKVVYCNICKSPVDLLCKGMHSIPFCSKCKPVDPFQVERKTQICQVCDSQITPFNMLQQSQLIQGLIMCRICYKFQFGEKEDDLEQKPDFREKYRHVPKNLFKFSENQLKLQNIKIQHASSEKKLKKNQSLPIFKHQKHQKQGRCRFCQKKLTNLNANDMCSECYSHYPSLNEKKLPNYLANDKLKHQLFQKLQYEKIQKAQQLKIEQQYQQDIQSFAELFTAKQITSFKALKSCPKNVKQAKIQNSVKSNEKIQGFAVQKVVGLQVQVDQTQKYSLKECKICFNAESQMMNSKCRHLMMCQPCYKMMLKKQKMKAQLCCPVCQTVGKYFKYLQPIFI